MMKRHLLLLAAAFLLFPATGFSAPGNRKKDSHTVVTVPEVRAQVISVETDGVQWLFNVDKAGVLRCNHFGKKIAAPEQFLDFTGARTRNGIEKYGDAAMAYPTVGGRYSNEPALHVKYADGYHNTELYYTGHKVSAQDGVTTTTIFLKDYESVLFPSARLSKPLRKSPWFMRPGRRKMSSSATAKSPTAAKNRSNSSSTPPPFCPSWRTNTSSRISGDTGPMR